MSFSERLLDSWYRQRLTPLTAALAPLSLMFRIGVAARRALFRAGVPQPQRLPVPVVVVGNITVGGSGKTPLTIALATELAARGWQPGIVSRGYGASAVHARAVARDASAKDVGDEPLLLARTGLPVWIGADRAAAARGLLAAHPQCNVIVTDDGLQHYALARDVEIAVIDASRELGNGWSLPAGPLREPASRLDAVDAIVRLARSPRAATPREFTMTLAGERFVRVNAPEVRTNADAFRNADVHALAGIGNPQRFFEQLRSLGIAATCHAFPDHHRFTPRELALPAASAILMTEKDAVKCASFADDRCWALPVRAMIDPALVSLIEEKLRGSKIARDTGVSGDQGPARA
ncbi:MAG: tetraacyldisaccharide 4'-kinase [Casimicrobiaceae bacterium]